MNIIKNGRLDLVDQNNTALFWGGWTSSSPAHTVVNGVSEHNPVGEPDFWSYQFSQEYLTALPNIPYRFSFTAWADAPRTFTVDFEDAPNNYNRYGISSDPRTSLGNGRSQWTFDITTVPTSYTFDVTFDQIQENTIQQVIFMLGTSNVKTYIDDILLISEADLLLVDSVDVTFQVNMQNEAISPNGVHINGSFSDWAEAVEMIHISGSLYEATLKLPVGETFEYKFVNGGREEWINYEIPPNACTIGENNNRQIIVPESNVILDAVCFNRCAGCPDLNSPLRTIREIQGEGDISPYAGQVVRTKGRIIALNQYGCFIQDTTGIRTGIFIYDPSLALQFNQGDHIEVIATVSEYNGRTQLSGIQWIDYTDELFWVYRTLLK
ncbi:MAG: hypothetical protein IPF54_14510 [Draconibacterium sp.]|nr:hypothetical protein [Draconibacterium sp.]